MKSKFYLLIKLLLITIILISSIFLQKNLNAQNWDVYYDSPPNVANCNPGVLKQSEKKLVLDTVNYLRSLNGLKPVTYDNSADVQSQATTLIMVANSTIDHNPTQSWQCYTNDGAQGAAASNLYISWYNSPSQAPTTLESVENWMIDNSVISLGHRRAIINPFLRSFSFGRCDGPPKVTSQYPYSTSMNFKWGGTTDQNISDWNSDFVAVPFQDYPIKYFDKSWFLSFSVFYDKTSWSSNQNVDYSNATIEMKDENQQNIPVISKTVDDNLFWGGVPNQLSWKASGLQDRKTYSVAIKNVNVNGTLKNYSYWFNLNNKGMAKPDDPVLFMPPDASTEVSTSPELQWNPAQRAYKYRIIVSKLSNFTSWVIDDPDVTDYHYSLASLEPYTTYYWKVSSSNEGGESGWSPVWSFTTAGAAPDIPIQVYPPTAKDSISLTPTLIWNKVLFADTYTLQVSATNDFMEPIINATGIIDTNYTVPSGKLYHDLNYFWRLKSVNETGESDWSGKRRFHTIDSITSVIEVLPSNYSVKLSNYPNPFNGKTNIIFNVLKSGFTQLKVYNSLGIELCTLTDTKMDEGTYITEFDGTFLPQGVYYIKLFTVTGTETGKMNLVK
ncbi:MAG: T9SS type A sorting domain-containing protein [Ignavibacteriae bacterium]|nr:T9SS type A sorting domain-containing protein [Ignavibacteriota bacterium]